MRYAMRADRRISGDDHDERILAMTRLTNGARKRRYVALCQIDNAHECRHCGTTEAARFAGRRVCCRDCRKQYQAEWVAKRRAA